VSDTKIVWVVAIALINEDGEILLTQRPEGKDMAGLWEFPGGKIENGETPEQAIIREIAEELDVSIKVESLVPITFISHRYPDKHVVIMLYKSTQWEGEPVSMDNQLIRWYPPQEIPALPMPAADVPLVEALLTISNSSTFQ